LTECDHPTPFAERSVRAFVAALATLLLAACSGQPLVTQYTPARTECCERVSDYPFQIVPLGKDVSFSFGSETSVLKVNERSSHMFGLKVPDKANVSTVQLTSYLSTDYIPKATAVSPELHFYSADFQLLGSSIASLQDARGFWRAALTGSLSVPTGSRFIVVVASSRAAGVVIPPSGRRYLIPPAALGEMSMRLFGAEER
jgi:hypothetical protein